MAHLEQEYEMPKVWFAGTILIGFNEQKLGTLLFDVYFPKLKFGFLTQKGIVLREQIKTVHVFNHALNKLNINDAYTCNIYYSAQTTTNNFPVTNIDEHKLSNSTDVINNKKHHTLEVLHYVCSHVQV